MGQFIRYLYEYDQEKRIRNVGFVKVEQEAERCVVHIHGKGLRLGAQTELGLYVFFVEDGICKGIRQGSIANINPALNYRLEFGPEDVEGYTAFDRISGVVLANPSGSRYAALWKEEPLNIGKMEEALPCREMPEELKEEPKEDSDRRESEISMENPAESVMPDEESTEQVPEQEEIPEKVSEASGTTEELTERKRQEDASAVETVPAAETDESVIEAQQEVLEEEIEEDRYIEPSGTKYYKIQRQDIARLPRCEWRLANNSFLLHGFYNYHHLVLIEEDGCWWLGVPGIYHEKEQAAARSFGFPQFTRLYNHEIDLAENETNNYEDFGYWCRQVRVK